MAENMRKLTENTGKLPKNFQERNVTFSKKRCFTGITHGFFTATDV
jgi:hypothetical protein